VTFCKNNYETVGFLTAGNSLSRRAKSSCAVRLVLVPQVV